MFMCSVCGYTKDTLNALPQFQVRRIASRSEEEDEMLCVSDDCSVCQRLTFFTQLHDNEAEEEEPPQKTVSKKAYKSAARSLWNGAGERVGEQKYVSGSATSSRHTFDTFGQRLHRTVPIREVQEVPAKLRTKKIERLPHLREGRGGRAPPDISHPCASPPQRTRAGGRIDHGREYVTGTEERPMPGCQLSTESDSESKDDQDLESMDAVYRRHNCYTSSYSGSSGRESYTHLEDRTTGGLHTTRTTEYFKRHQKQINAKQKQMRCLDHIKLHVKTKIKKTEMELQQLEKEKEKEHAARQDRKKRHSRAAHSTSMSLSMWKAKQLVRVFQVLPYFKDRGNPRADALLSPLVQSIQEQAECKEKGTQTEQRRHKKTIKQE